MPGARCQRAAGTEAGHAFHAARAGLVGSLWVGVFCALQDGKTFLDLIAEQIKHMREQYGAVQQHSVHSMGMPFGMGGVLGALFRKPTWPQLAATTS